MISKMKKLTLLTYHKEYEDFLLKLRQQGVVHVEERQQGAAESAELQSQLKLTARLNAAIKLMHSLADKSAQTPTADADAKRGLALLDEIESLQTDNVHLQQQAQAIAKDEATLSVWGNFEQSDIDRLADADYVVNFYSCPASAFNKQWEEDYNAITVDVVSSKVYFVTVTKSGVIIDIDAEQVKLPATSLKALGAQRAEAEQKIAANEERLAAIAATEQPSLNAALKAVRTDIEFAKVELNTERMADEKLMLLEGWLPAREESSIKSFLDDSNAYYEIADPTPEDNVPIQFNNKGYFSWFEAICKLYMLPKYNELDLTPFFAPFFMIFFGLCLGDSGYGLLLFTGATVYRLVSKKLSKSVRSILSLVQVLAASAFFCGFLTGTFFGANIYDIDLPFIQRLKSAIFMDNNDMFQLSLVLGIIQIVFGMVLKAVNQTIQFGFKYALSTIGWIVLIVSVAIAAMAPSVLPMGGTVHSVILGAACILIFLLNSPGKNIFLNIGLGLWDTYNMVTGLLGDVLSYVRLFALGLSGGILAGVFNSLATGMSPDNAVLGPIVMVLIFVIGHSINIFMNVLGAMVHPMRLTFVEFFKNSGYTGGGKEYKPFKNEN
jgi:V/A-type H+-transporting ATPase subunit I